MLSLSPQSQPQPSTPLTRFITHLRHKNYHLAYNSTMSLTLATILFIIKQLQILALLSLHDRKDEPIYKANPNLRRLHTVAEFAVLEFGEQTGVEERLWVVGGLLVGQIGMFVAMLWPCYNKDINRTVSKLYTIGNIILPIPTILLFSQLALNFTPTPTSIPTLTLSLLSLLLSLINHTIYTNFHFCFSLKNTPINILSRFPNFWVKQYGWLFLAAIQRSVVKFGYPNFFVVYLCGFVGWAAYDGKRFAVEFQYFQAKLNRNLGILALVSFTIGVAMLSYFLGIELVKNSLTSFTCAFCLFFINFFLTLRKFWIKRIIIDDNTTTQITQITYVTTFILFSISLDQTQKKNQTYISSLLKNHCNNCTSPLCCCKTRDTIYDPQTSQSGNKKLQPHLDPVFVKHFYLKMIEDSILEFPRSVEIRMLGLLYRLEFLELGAECVRGFREFGRKMVWEKLTGQQRFALFCIEEEFKKFIVENNWTKGNKQIQRVKKFDQLHNTLVCILSTTTQNLHSFWQTLHTLHTVHKNRPLSPSFLSTFSIQTLTLTKQIQEIYTLMKNINPNSAALRDLMILYARDIVGDMDLLGRVRKDLKMQSMGSTGRRGGGLGRDRGRDRERDRDGGQKIQLDIYGSQTANLVVCGVNEMIWVSNNAKDIFGYKKNSTLLKTPINNLMPPFFGNSHDTAVKKWLQTGKCQKMNKTHIIWCRRQNGACFRSTIYIKILPYFLSQTEKDIHYYISIEHIGGNQILCGDDGEIYGCDEGFRNLVRCPIKTIQAWRPNIQIIFPALFQQFFTYFYTKAGQKKKRGQQRVSGYIPGKIAQYLTNFGKQKQAFLTKNKKNPCLPQIYGLYLQIKMQQITMNIKGKFVTVDFELERVEQLGRELLVLRMRKVQVDTVERYFSQFQKTIKKIVGVKEGLEGKKEAAGGMSKKMEQNTGKNALQVFLNPKKLKKIHKNPNQPLKPGQNSENILNHRKQRAINQLVQIKNQRARNNIDRMKKALFQQKIISANTYRTLTVAKQEDDMYIFQEEEDYEEVEAEKTKTKTVIMKPKTKRALFCDDRASEQQLLDDSYQDSIGRLRQRDQQGLSFQQSTASSAAHISLSTKIRLLKQKLQQTRPKLFLILTNILFFLTILTTISITTYQLIYEIDRIEIEKLEKSQMLGLVKITEGLMVLGVVGQGDGNGGFKEGFEKIIYQQLSYFTKNGYKMENKNIQPNPFNIELQFQNGKLTMNEFFLYQLQQSSPSTIPTPLTGTKQFTQIITILQTHSLQKLSQSLTPSNSLYLLIIFFIIKILIFINLYISFKNINKITGLITQLYPHQKEKNMKIFGKLEKKVAGMLINVEPIEEESKARQSCLQKIDSKSSYNNSENSTDHNSNEYLKTILCILLIFTLIYISSAISFIILKSLDTSTKTQTSRLDQISLNKLKLTYKFLTLYQITLNNNKNNNNNNTDVKIQKEMLQALTWNKSLAAMLVKLYNWDGIDEKTKDVIGRYCTGSPCEILGEEWGDLEWACGLADNDSISQQKGLLNQLQYIQQQLQYYSQSLPTPSTLHHLHLPTLLTSSQLLQLSTYFTTTHTITLQKNFIIKILLFFFLIVIPLITVTWIWYWKVYKVIGMLGSKGNCYLLMVPFQMLIQNPYMRQFLMEELGFRANAF